MKANERIIIDNTEHFYKITKSSTGEQSEIHKETPGAQNALIALVKGLIEEREHPIMFKDHR